MVPDGDELRFRAGFDEAFILDGKMFYTRPE